MAKKLMIDMKINGKRTVKTLSSEKKESVRLPVKETPEIKVEKKPLPIPEHIPQDFAQDESLKRAAVFTSGWRAESESTAKNEEIPKEKSDTIAELYHREPSKRISQSPQIKKSPRSIGKGILFVFLISLILGLGYWCAVFFEHATIVIQEKSALLTLTKDQFTASKSSQAPIHFEIMIVSDTDAKNMILTDSQDVSTKAKGTVTLYNEYSTKAVTISVNSFLADENGKTYKTDKAVTIPGYKTVTGKVVPGQMPVGITAFLPGDSYNGTPTDFTINAYKETTKFKKIYAKAATALSGGAQGLVYVLGATDKGSLNATAASTFKSRLLKKLNAEVPKGYILYPDAVTFSYTVNDNVQSPTPDAKVAMKGVLSAIIFKENEITDAVIKESLPSVLEKERAEIEVPDISKLAFSFASANQSIDKEMQSVSFTLSGGVTAYWHPNKDDLKVSLVGALKTDLPSIFKLDPGIVEARATVFPPWQKYLPTQTSKIHISVE